ncbi:MAG: hypothetical protein A2W80_05985 [Candidatus Riflebacteria bacterium GWC2_50_8]|nr:MAG: hypothetical protein A2W80_05985 [Candidatus Riflebacteria bacterium GWC2_50_8]
MKAERFVLFCFLILYLVFQPVVSAIANAGNATLEARLAALEGRFVVMQSDYQQQIASLTAQINLLQGKAAGATDRPDEQQSLPATVSADSADAELLALRQAAAIESQSAETSLPEKSADAGRKFIAGDLSRQAENPEISIVGDFVYRLQSIDGQRKNSDAMLRNLGIHYETYLDPYTKFKGAVPVKEDISNLGEAYITRFGLTPNLNFTIGKFRQQFGVVQRWHMAGLDQNEFPLAMRRVLGDGGLCENGISLDWQLGSSGKTTRELTMQLTESTNARLFAGNTRGMPHMLLHFKSFRDVSADTYQELGLTALAGVNDQWSVSTAGVVNTIDETRPVYGFGLDFTHLWEPTDNMRYRNFMWRTEFYGVRKEILRPDNGDRGAITAWGGYSNVHWKLDRQLESGLRIDYFEPDSQKYAAVPGFALSPLAVVANSPSEWQFCPYLTWQQSPWVKYRLEFNYKSGNNMGPDERRLMLQCIWSAGPHKHDRY